MGLAEQRKKQRIGEDPQNLNWSTNTGRFGFKMLEKMGWAPGKGLGAQEDGTLLHIKATVKTNQRGLGADVKTIDNWIDNTSGFSQILAKLNKESTREDSTVDETEKEQPVKKSKKEKKDKKNKKEKKLEKEDEDSHKSKRAIADDETESGAKKAKKEKKFKKDKKDKKEKNTVEEEKTNNSPLSNNLRQSHRARYVQNKRMSTRDPANLSAIFGVRG